MTPERLQEIKDEVNRGSHKSVPELLEEIKALNEVVPNYIHELEADNAKLREALEDAISEISAGIHSTDKPCHPVCRICTRDLPHYKAVLREEKTP